MAEFLSFCSLDANRGCTEATTTNQKGQLADVMWMACRPFFQGNQLDRNCRVAIVAKDVTVITLFLANGEDLGVRGGLHRDARLSYTHFSDGIPPIAAPFNPGVKHYADLPRTCDATRSAGAVLTDEGQKLMIPCFSQLARLVQQMFDFTHSEL